VKFKKPANVNKKTIRKSVNIKKTLIIKQFFKICLINFLEILFFARLNLNQNLLTNLNFKVMSDIAARVKAIIVDKLGVDENEVTPEASFTNDLGADSLDTVELIMEFEKEFNIAIPDDQAENIGTVGEAIKFIEANVK
jgi:acyl carrier protein